MPKFFHWVCCCLLAIAGASCSRQQATPTAAVRLFDLFEDKDLQGRSETAALSFPRTEWRFSSDASATGSLTNEWKSGNGVADLVVKDGLLTGRVTEAPSLILVERTTGTDDLDPLHAVEVRLRASEGSYAAVIFNNAEKFDIKETVESLKLSDPLNRTELKPGNELQTYLITIQGTSPAKFRRVILQPTDKAGANFAIESVRLIFRREQLAQVKSGPGWQGLSEVYRETLVARAPEAIRMPVTLPSRPWLDLAIGSIEERPVTFRVAVESGGSSETLLQRTVTRPYRWERLRADLSRFGGRPAQIVLELSSEKPGTIGFWGSPVIRERVTVERTAGPSKRHPLPQGVILIMVDTLRADHLDAYGYERATAPLIASLAKDGVLFTDCSSQATWTKVSTPSIMTGLYPSSHGIKDGPDRLPASAHTLAESFRQAGYATLSFSSVAFTGKFTSLHQGFEELHESASLGESKPSKTSREFVSRFLPWLEDHRDVPFFVYLHLFDPHDPYEPETPYDALWAPASQKEQFKTYTEKLKKEITHPFRRNRGLPTVEELRRTDVSLDEFVAFEHNWYDGSIRGMNAEVGRVMERLRELGLEEKTLVIFLSDHGEEFLEHGYPFHGQSVYSELTHVPLAFRWPGVITPGQRVDEPVQLIDVMPTILSFCGLPIPKEVQGQSLLPLMRSSQPALGPDTTWKAVPVISERRATSERGSAPIPHDLESYAIQWEGWKLIHNIHRHDDRPEFELFDRKKDPLDKHNLAAEHPERVEALSKKLAAWKEKVVSFQLPPDSTLEQQLSPDEAQRLRALGYLGGGTAPTNKTEPKKDGQ